MSRMKTKGVSYSSEVKGDRINISRRGTSGGNRDITIPTEFIYRMMEDLEYGSTKIKTERLLSILQSIQKGARERAPDFDPVKSLALLGRVWALCAELESEISLIPDQAPNRLRALKSECTARMAAIYVSSMRIAAILNHQGQMKHPEVSIDLNEEFDLELLLKD